MSKLLTVITASTLTLTAITNGDKVTAKSILEAHNSLAVALTLPEVKKFASKEKGIAALTAIIATANEAEKTETPKEETVKAPAKTNKDDKVKTDGKEEPKEKVAKVGRVGLLVTTYSKADDKAEEVAATPTKMCGVKISTFKNATKVTLNRAPSEPQRLWLVKLGCWEKTTVDKVVAA